jgi:hypothetical protein
LEYPRGIVYKNNSKTLWIVGLEALDHELDRAVVLL